MIQADIIRPQLTTTYAEFTLTTVAPEGAQRAEIYASSDAANEWIYVDWVSFLPNPKAVMTGMSSASGDVANGYTQRISVEPGKRYRLAEWIRGSLGGETGRVQVNWYSSSGSFLGASITLVGLSTAWVHRQIDTTAPTTASTAEIYVSSERVGNRVLLDDFSFTHQD